MRRAYAMAGFGASTVGLFEAHGTGTVAGDTAELESTTRLMQEEGAPAGEGVRRGNRFAPLGEDPDDQGRAGGNPVAPGGVRRDLRRAGRL